MFAGLDGYGFVRSNMTHRANSHKPPPGESVAGDLADPMRSGTPRV
jgi:hypothetical protein